MWVFSTTNSPMCWQIHLEFNQWLSAGSLRSMCPWLLTGDRAYQLHIGIWIKVITRCVCRDNCVAEVRANARCIGVANANATTTHYAWQQWAVACARLQPGCTVGIWRQCLLGNQQCSLPKYTFCLCLCLMANPTGRQQSTWLCAAHLYAYQEHTIITTIIILYILL